MGYNGPTTPGDRVNSPQRILIISRIRPLDLFESADDPRLVRLRRRDPDYLKVLEDEQRRLDATLATVQSVIESRGYSPDLVPVNRAFNSAPYPLVVVVGGDGTVLGASHSILNIPVLGVSTSPLRSVGFFCGATSESFAALLDGWLGRTAPSTQVTRMEVVVGDRQVATPILNDALYCHSNPAAMTTCQLRVGGASELQHSSGIWISTGAGSTAAMLSAGGFVMPLDSPDLQYRVREPFVKKGGRYQLVGGPVPGEEGLRIICRTGQAGLYLDGHIWHLDLEFGDEVRLRRSPHPLTLIGVDNQKQQGITGAAK